MSRLRISNSVATVEPIAQAQAARVGTAVEREAQSAESFRPHPVTWRQQRNRKMFGPLQQRMEKLLDLMSEDPSLSLGSRRSIARLRAFSWAADVAALSSLFEECPSLVDAYLDLMVCTLHEFPLTGEGSDGPPVFRRAVSE